MNVKTASEIGKKAKAFKHLHKLIENIEKTGEATVKLNCTGVSFKVLKGDSLYLRFLTLMAQLREELTEFDVISRKKNIPAVAPVASAPVDEMKKAIQREKRNAYMREYMKRKREKKKK